MSDDKLFAMDNCFVCGQVFSFDPETVISVWVDPVTNRPPDVNVFGEQITPDPAAVERAVRRPICFGDVIRLRRAGKDI
jgi:hypothetical protein